MNGEERVVVRREAGEVVGDVLGDGTAAGDDRIWKLLERPQDHLLVGRVGAAGGARPRRRRR